MSRPNVSNKKKNHHVRGVQLRYTRKGTKQEAKKSISAQSIKSRQVGADSNLAVDSNLAGLKQH